MTAIAGFCDKGTVWMGGDSAGVAGNDLTLRADPKVFRNGEFLFGFTTSFRMGQLIRFRFKPPVVRECQDLFEYMATDFVDALRECLKVGGFAAKDKEREEGGTFLVGVRGRLFLVDSDYQIEEPLDQYEACGCGHPMVRGALFATQGMEDSRARIELALMAAERHSTGVRGPFVIEHI
jgi:hypothetical protein